MDKWISVNKALPLNDSFVKVKACILFWDEYDALFIEKHFVREGENITKWVFYWKPVS